jgi:uncharacterized protein YndB with AHSA1/START domain
MTTTTPTATGFTIERTFAAGVEEVWKAWTDPDEAQHWWHPRGVHTPGSGARTGHDRHRPRSGGATAGIMAPCRVTGISSATRASTSPST